jgi:hypothetical protein
VPQPGVASVVRSGAALRSSLGLVGPQAVNSRKSLRNGCRGALYCARAGRENEDGARAAIATGARGSYGLVGRSLLRLGDRSPSTALPCSAFAVHLQPNDGAICTGRPSQYQ